MRETNEKGCEDNCRNYVISPFSFSLRKVLGYSLGETGVATLERVYVEAADNLLKDTSEGFAESLKHT